MGIRVRHYMMQPGLDIVAFDEGRRFAVWRVEDEDPKGLENEIRASVEREDATLEDLVARFPGGEVREGEYVFSP